MSAPTEYAPRHAGDNRVLFEIPVGPFTVAGRGKGADNITVHRGEDLVCTRTVPGYKIWNVAAHCPEWIDDLEAIYQADLAARLVRDLTNPTPCRRCDGVPTSHRTCAACLHELNARPDDDRDDYRDSGVDPYTGGQYRGAL